MKKYNERSNLADTDVSISYSAKTSALIERISQRITKNGDAQLKLKKKQRYK